MKNKHHMTETVTKTLYKKIPRRGIWKLALSRLEKNQELFDNSFKPRIYLIRGHLKYIIFKCRIFGHSLL